MTTQIELQILEAVQAGNYTSANALIAALTPTDISTFSSVNMERIMYEMAFDVTSGLGVTNVDVPTNAIRNFASRLSSVLTVNAVDISLSLLATQINLKDSADYRAIDAITDNMSAALKQALPANIKETVILSISQNILDGLMIQNSNLVEQSTAALRDFMSKFGAYLGATEVDDALSLLSNDLSFWGNGDYRSIDAITDYMTSTARAALADTVKTAIITNFSWDVGSGLWGNTALGNKATDALRDFMTKFGNSIKAVSVEDALVNLSATANYADSSDYRGIDAITDYMSGQAKADLSVYAKTQIIGHFTDNIFDGTLFGNTILHDQSVVALDDFAAKFSASLSFDTVSQATDRLIDMHDPVALSAILDNVIDTVLGQIKTSFASDLTASGYDIYTNTTTTIIDGAESSTIFALNGSDVVYARDGNDVVLGGKGNDYLYGENGNDVLYGGIGNDYLLCGNGNDTLFGGLGVDTLYGNTGIDTFMIEALSSGDRIMDFKALEGDKIDLSQILEPFDPVTHTITEFVKATTVSGVTSLAIDVDGASGSAGFVEAAKFYNVTGLDIVDLYNKSQIVV